MAGQRVNREAVGRAIGQLRQLIEFAEQVERVNADDLNSYCRNMIRTLSDIAWESDRMSQMLTAQAVKDKAVTVTEAAAAAQISRNAVYKRVAAYFDPDEDEQDAPDAP